MAEKKLRRARPHKLRTKLFGQYLIILLLMVSLFAIVFYSSVSRLLIDRGRSELETTADSILSGVTGTLREMDQLSANINYYNMKYGILKDDTNASDKASAVAEYVVAINGTVMKANQINLYGANGVLTQVGAVSKTVSFDPEELEWYGKAVALGGSKMIGTPYRTRRYSPGSQSMEWYLSLCRASIGPGGRIDGAIETVRKCRTLFGDIQTYTRKTDHPASVYIFNDDGTCVYPYDTQEDTDKMYALVLDIEAMSADANTPVQDPRTGEDSRFVLKRSSYCGWTFLVLQSDQVVLAPVASMARMLVILTCFMVLFSILLSYLLARGMVLPVERLKRAVHGLRLETLGTGSVADAVMPYEELDGLYREFENMNVSLKASLNELENTRTLELRSRMIALQAQMNPHFYYNTLSCISILAENGQTEEVTRLCSALSSMMRYVSDSRSMTVHVRDEADHIREYLYCMKIRYEESLDYRIDIPPSMLDRELPRLTIQPLIENAIKYGTQCEPPWRLNITGEETRDLWAVTVEDSGTGFTDESLEKLHARFAEIDASPDASAEGLRIGGLGLINVYIRWKLFCGTDMIFEFGNTPEGHAFVRIGRKTQNRLTAERNS